MADQKRVHPMMVDVESPPSTIAAKSPISEKAAASVSPTRTVAPEKRLRRRRFRRCCCRCFCCAACALVLLAAALGISYLALDPMLPAYSVDGFQVTSFDMSGNGTVRAAFDVTVTASNPNKGLGICYGRGSRLRVLYSGQALCEGAFPAFCQGHRNTSVLTVALATGEAVELGSAKAEELRRQEEEKMVPLEFEGEVPVRVTVVGVVKLWKVVSWVRCSLVVDSLNARQKIHMKKSSCKFSVHL
ncbi:NDR1/HIN1-like protein 6 [Curcuma longa]|uniref:NDR1/HIN1-like protein 6 n=1 Tax=Curcuma longa TaxID=136217 RepID=UPI003D9F06D7